jgi:hypothetical protein
MLNFQYLSMQLDRNCITVGREWDGVERTGDQKMGKWDM